jgi:hypothetical protein
MTKNDTNGIKLLFLPMIFSQPLQSNRPRFAVMFLAFIRFVVIF